MKVIVAGATGYLATEVVRQALAHPSITRVIALARRETAIPDKLYPSSDTAKFKSVVCQDFNHYSPDVLAHLAGADACIWTIAITPIKALNKSPDLVREVCLDYTAKAVETFAQLRREAGQKPLRFIYASGDNVVRDNPQRHLVFGDYGIIRAQAEIKVMETAKGNKSSLEACCARLGLILPPTDSLQNRVKRTLLGTMVGLVGVPPIELQEASAAVLKLAIQGNFDKDPYRNSDLVELGSEALKELNIGSRD